MEEREAIVAYLKSQLIADPVDEVEEHFDNCLYDIIRHIEKGLHR